MVTDTYEQEEAMLPALQPTYSDEPDETYVHEIPRLRLMQATSAEVQESKARNGAFWIDDIGEIPQPVRAMPIKRAKYRQYRIAKEVDPTTPLVCQSSDAIVGYGQPGGNCETCPVQKACRLVISYQMLIQLEEEKFVAVRWDLSRTGMRTAERINRYVLENGFGNFAIAITSKLVGQEGAKYQVPEVTKEESTHRFALLAAE